MESSRKHPNRGGAAVWIGLALSAGSFVVNMLRLFM